MSLFRKKADPISARSKELSAQISELEQQIRRLSSNIERGEPEPSSRPDPLPANGTPTLKPGREPVFETLDRTQRQVEEAETGSNHYNDLGVRKYDLFGALRRARKLVNASPAENPKLVTYLAAGSVKGLKPLRYEKRIARNRFIFLSALFALILWGLIAAFFNHR